MQPLKTKGLFGKDKQLWNRQNMKLPDAILLIGKFLKSCKERKKTGKVIIELDMNDGGISEGLVREATPLSELEIVKKSLQV